MNNFDSINSKDPRPPKIIVSDKPITQTKSLNLLTQKSRVPKSRKIIKLFVWLVVVAIVLLISYVTWRASNLSDKIFVGQKTTFFGRIMELIRGSDSTVLQGEDLGQVNILLLGIGGEGHDGPYLTDTMILAQIRPDTGEATLTSIPRDYWVNLPNNGGQNKINSAFALAFAKNKNWKEGGDAARQVVENISGLKIPYFAVIDFSGFEKAVDQVGGLTVNVERTFTDSEYPDNGVGYLAPITFTAGEQHFDGVKALQFARSRHAAGIEGSDFSRSLRQQKIIDSFKQKVISLNIISDAAKINNLMGTFADHFHTNISPAEVFRLYSLVKNKNINNFLSLSLDPETNLICPEILESNGAYVLTPCPGNNEDDVKNFFKNSFSIGKLTAEQSTVWLANSTGDKKVYQTAYKKLTDAGITVFELPYTKDNLPETLVYGVNQKPATLEFIKNILNAQEVSIPPPNINLPKDRVDVIVILGLNAPAETPAPYIPPPARKATTTTTTVETISTSTPPK